MVLLQEKRMSLTELARRENKSIPTVFRWKQKGIRGIKLETFLIGRNRYTTEEAFARWVAATTADRDGEQPVVKARTNRQREAGYSEAERYLAGEGID